MKILLLNAGSSSLKGTLTESAGGMVLARCLADWAGDTTRYQYTGPDGFDHSGEVAWKGHAKAVERLLLDLTNSKLTELSALGAVGHRVVHGGDFSSSVRVTPEIRDRIAALADLAPLHNPPSLEALSAAESALPNVSQIAVFDTAFHATLPAVARTYPVPFGWTRDWGIRRYGFHGLSHAYASRRAAEMLGRDAGELRLVICHLGHGCSATAVRAGISVDTTMGFTPVDGLMMATRSGAIDPGIVMYVQQRHGLTPAQVESALNHESGLKGVSGISSDMRQVLASARAGHEQARLALSIYSHRVRQAIGSLTVTMGGVDAVVFTAGVGENACEVREAICAGLECLGLDLDAELNAVGRPDADVARRNSRGRILVIAAREDVTMLDEVMRALAC